eukprot:m.44077 g.44077  ORF g.44077 m.44077 type:complete len:209 (+) comp5812_c0_seq1:102-728(+)
MSCCAMLKRIFGAQGEPVLDVGRQYKLGKYMVTVVEVIAQGGFAIVYKVETEDTTPYALKVVRLHDQESLDVTAREIEVMRLLSGHANTVKLFAADMRPNGRFTEQLILMEYCPGGHVIGIMNRRLQRRFNEAEVLKVCAVDPSIHVRFFPTLVLVSPRSTSSNRPSFTAISSSKTCSWAHPTALSSSAILEAAQPSPSCLAPTSQLP